MATDNGLDGQVFGVRDLVGSIFFSFPCHLDRFGGPTQPPIQWALRSSSRGYKVDGSLSWPLPTSAEVKWIYTSTPLFIHLHGVVLNRLSTGTIIPILHFVLVLFFLFAKYLFNDTFLFLNNKGLPLATVQGEGLTFSFALGIPKLRYHSEFNSRGAMSQHYSLLASIRAVEECVWH
jgi:hypothetical protein